jgi:hypothetical protein
MTQENKDLLLRDLCARLPYGVKIKVPSWDEREMEYVDRIDVLYSINGDEYIKSTNEDYDFDLEDIKPYLFPLSSMTEEQLKEMKEIIGNPNEACISVNTSGLELWLNSIDTDPTIWLDTIFEVQNWLNKNHFDYRGLIEKGLALDATNLNIY